MNFCRIKRFTKHINKSLRIILYFPIFLSFFHFNISDENSVLWSLAVLALKSSFDSFVVASYLSHFNCIDIRFIDISCTCRKSKLRSTILLQLEPLLRKLTKGPVLHTIATLSRRVSSQCLTNHHVIQKRIVARVLSDRNRRHATSLLSFFFVVSTCTTAARTLRELCAHHHHRAWPYIFIHVYRERPRLGSRMANDVISFTPPSFLSRKLLANVAIVNAIAARNNHGRTVFLVDQWL